MRGGVAAMVDPITAIDTTSEAAIAVVVVVVRMMHWRTPNSLV
jgi:hypothetical protein